MSSSGNPLASLIVRFIAEAQPFLDGVEGMKSSTASAVDNIDKAFESVGFEHLLEGFAEVAAAIGLATGAIDLAKESLAAFSKEQDVLTSFTLLRGSAEDAENALANLDKQAVALAIPFEALLSTAQRLAPQFGVGTAQLQTVLTAAADAAAATGRDFQTVAEGLDRIAISGTVGTRQLNQFGVSIQEIAKQMGVSVDEAYALLKKGGQSAQADVDAIVGAIEARFGGAAGLIAQNLSGQFVNIKNQIHFLEVDIGAALEPIASGLIKAFDDALPSVKAFVATAALVVTGLNDIATSLGSLVPEFVKLAGSAQSMTALGTATAFLGAAIGAIVDTAHAAVKQLTDLIVALNPFSDGLQRFQKDNQEAAAALQKSWVDNFKAIAEQGNRIADSIPKVGEKIGDTLANTGETLAGIAGGAVKLNAALEDTSGADASSDAHKRLEAALKLAETELGQVNKAHQLGSASAQNVAAAQEKVRSILAQLHPEWEATGVAIGKASSSLDKLVGPADFIGAALRNVGLKSLADEADKAQNELSVATEAFAAGRIGIEEYADAIEKAHQAQEKARPSVKTLEDVIRDFNPILNGTVDAAGNVVKGLNELSEDTGQKLGAALALAGSAMGQFGIASLSVDATLHSFGESTVKETSDRIQSLETDIDNLTAALRVGAPGAAEALALKFQELGRVIAASADSAPFRDLGLHSQGYLDTMAEKAQQDFDAILASGTAAAEDLDRTWLAKTNEMLKAGQDLSADAAVQYVKIQRSLENLNPTFRSVIAIENEVKAAGKNIASGIADIVTAGKNWADAFESIGQKIAHDVIEGLIVKSLKGVEDQITGLITKLGQFLGLIGSGGGVLGTSVGAAGKAGTSIPGIPSLGGGGTDLGGLPGVNGQPGIDLGSSGGGGLTSALGSVTGILGAVGSIGSLISGVIGNFQSARQETTLNAIEGNTRYLNVNFAIFLTQYWPTFQDSVYAIHDAAVASFSDLGNIWTELIAFRADFNRIAGGVTPKLVGSGGSVTIAAGAIVVNGVTDPRAVAQEVASELADILKIQSTAFSY